MYKMASPKVLLSFLCINGFPETIFWYTDIAPNRKPLDWNTRMKIAEGAARGLEYLHETADPPVIYRDFKASNILLDETFNPKLSDFGLAKLGPTGDKSHVSTRVMGTYGYCAPEYALTGQLTTKSDVYSFGVVFLEIITGRRVIDNTRATEEQNLVTWVCLVCYHRERERSMRNSLAPLKLIKKILSCRHNHYLETEGSSRKWRTHYLKESIL